MDGGPSPLSRAGLASWRAARRPGRLVRRERVPAVLALAGFAAAVTGLLGWHVDGDDSGDRADDVLEGVVDTVAPMQSGPGRLLGEAVANLGSPISTVLLMLLVAAFAYLRCGPRALALVLVGPPIAMITTTTILKPLIGRTRGDELAFPSGHTTSVTAIATALAVIVLSLSLPRTVRRWTLVVLVVGPAAAAFCLVGREYHYPTDAVGAVGVALAVVLLTAVVVDAMADSMADDEPHEVGPAERAGDGPEPLRADPAPGRPTPTVVPVGGAFPLRPPPGGRPMPMGPLLPPGSVGARPEPNGAVPNGPVPGAPAPAAEAPPTEPVAPLATEPATAEPTEVAPEAAEPGEVELTAAGPADAAVEPEVAAPEVVEPDIAVPEAAEPDVPEPAAAEPDVPGPEAAEPDVTEQAPEGPESEAAEPAEPDIAKPEASGPDAAEPAAVASSEEPADGSPEGRPVARRRPPVRHRTLALRTPRGPRRGA